MAIPSILPLKRKKRKIHPSFLFNSNIEGRAILLFFFISFLFNNSVFFSVKQEASGTCSRVMLARASVAQVVGPDHCNHVADTSPSLFHIITHAFPISRYDAAPARRGPGRASGPARVFPGGVGRQWRRANGGVRRLLLQPRARVAPAGHGPEEVE